MTSKLLWSQRFPGLRRRKWQLLPRGGSCCSPPAAPVASYAVVLRFLGREVDVSIVIQSLTSWNTRMPCFIANCGRTNASKSSVDDCSTDRITEALSQVDGITYLQREKLGFVASCNRGAEKARGRYLVF
jgi:hypothetical protein